MENSAQVERYVEMSDAEIYAAVASAKCAACTRTKRPGYPFCDTDYTALALPQRLWLKSDLVGGFRAALAHLRGHLERRREMSNNNWPYRTQEDLEAAGFRLGRMHFRCEVPRPDSDRKPPHICGEWLSIWITPRNAKVAVEDRTMQPHRANCADPDYFQRKRDEQAKRVQASAQRKTKTKARR